LGDDDQDFGGAAFLLLATAFAQAQDNSRISRAISIGASSGRFAAAGRPWWKACRRSPTPSISAGPAAASGRRTMRAKPGSLSFRTARPPRSARSPSRLRTRTLIYIGTGQPEPRYDIAAGLGVFKSTDGGAHWTSLGLANTRYIGRIWVDPKNENIVLVGAQGHFFGPSADAASIVRRTAARPGRRC
jgi:hypothetical protein